MNQSPTPNDANRFSNSPEVATSNRSELARPEREQRAEVLRLSQDVARLQERSSLLIGLLVLTVLLFGGAVAWFSVRFQSLEQQQQAAEATPAAEIAPEVAARIEALETQIQDLSQRLPDTLEQELQNNQTRLKDLAAQMKQIQSRLQNLRGAVPELDQLLDELTPNPNGADAPAPSGEPTPSENATP